jgi:hypothetical protein
MNLEYSFNMDVVHYRFFYFVRNKLTKLNLTKVNADEKDGADLRIFVEENAQNTEQLTRFSNEG